MAEKERGLIWRALQLAVLGAAGLMVGVTLIAVLLHYVPFRGPLLIALTSGVPFLVGVAFIPVVIFAGLRQWMATGVAVLAAAALVHTQVPLVVSADAPEGQSITVVSVNLLKGHADLGAVEALVRDSGADILSLQEVTTDWLDRARVSGIAQRLPYEHSEVVPFAAAAGSALFSRTPLRGHGVLDDTAFKNLRAVTDLPGARGTRVLVIHPAAPTGDAQDWVNDTDAIRKHLHALGDGPVIAIGDYNATWDQARFRGILRNGYADAGEQAGSGFLPTYPTNGRLGNRPVVAIDHVITKGFVATSVRTHFVAGSDHRALVVKLVAA
ncbi:endonuclease/exonuclease/phosphatase family protein [Gordonia sp. (in: high G+C Gram-positive bacteria)]|uniref:endonuclease/exonuclease/phosphatase family protein n=1 Tax=Gordonia sp. (in: high G+C Gram-positive bacteria) TaxID=84139 RepID=UPI0025C20C61|nr:endonuclease/exonuclease/phosphatase family protein [Gordonia sp. (in: high G+C Gram-positive bacteria)]HMS77074.1 endonuclease/exonuclease/phosphatase family protein [Gordonia sp. (in: high G+C Gram-positive bacteria)]